MQLKVHGNAILKSGEVADDTSNLDVGHPEQNEDALELDAADECLRRGERCTF